MHQGVKVRDDSDLGIDWRMPADKILLSDKDSGHPNLRNIKC